jgi:4-amino-4-deoxy-L-arabinose transferase-like glycosyltransferase
MRRWLPLIDALYVAALMGFVLVGIPIVPFHGDEPMQIYMSGDFETAFVDGNSATLTQGPPYFIDDNNQLRILNGSVQRYLVGLARTVIGIGRDQLPPRPGWDWGLDYARNVETGHRPGDPLLFTGRAVSAGLLALSVPLMFALGWQIGGRQTAYLAAGLYALHPIVLLNGRRAVQEGAMLFFGLLFVLTSAVIARRQTERRRSTWLWPLLALTGALAIASKHNTLVFVGGGLSWIVLASLFQPARWRRLAVNALACALTLAVSVAGFLALSPALWSDPPARLSDLLAVRAELLDLQVRNHANGPTTVGERLGSLLTQPFLTPPQYFEAPAWAGYEPITAEIERYEASLWAGYPVGGWFGVLLTGAAVVGAFGLWVRPWWPQSRCWIAVGLWAWALITSASLLVNPLDWQRYSLPLIPPAVLFAASGLTLVIAQVMLRWERVRSATAGA